MSINLPPLSMDDFYEMCAELQIGNKQRDKYIGALTEQIKEKDARIAALEALLNPPEEPDKQEPVTPGESTSANGDNETDVSESKPRRGRARQEPAKPPTE